METITRVSGSRVGFVLVVEKRYCSFLLKKLGWMTFKLGQHLGSEKKTKNGYLEYKEKMQYKQNRVFLNDSSKK